MEKKGAFDYILLETTGLADPGNLAPLFWVDDGLGSTIYLDGIVTLVDAKNILLSLDDPNDQTTIHEGDDHSHKGPALTTAHLQISHADVVVINKADLVSEEDLNNVKSRVLSINGAAKIHVTEQGVVPKLEGFLLDLHAYDQFSEAEAAAKGHSHLDPVSATVVRGASDRLIKGRPSPPFPFRLIRCGQANLSKSINGCDRCSGTISFPKRAKKTSLKFTAQKDVWSWIMEM